MLKRQLNKSVDLSADLENNYINLYENDKEVNIFCDLVAEYFGNFNNMNVHQKVALIEDFEHQLCSIRKMAKNSISFSSHKRLSLTIEAFQKAHAPISNTTNSRIICITCDD